jgi:hypothetical protein
MTFWPRYRSAVLTLIRPFSAVVGSITANHLIRIGICPVDAAKKSSYIYLLSRNHTLAASIAFAERSFSIRSRLCAIA